MKTRKVSPDAISEMQQNYHGGATAPQDAYWQEGLIGASDHLLIELGDTCAGYFVLNASGQLMQFHLQPEFQRGAPHLFQQVLARHKLVSAFAATSEPFYFSLCLDHQQSAQTHTYLFSDHGRVQAQLSSIQGTHFRQATHDDLLKVLPLFGAGDEFVDTETVEALFEGPAGYAKMVIEAGILNVLEKDGEILGTGEFRRRESWVPFADVGMIVNQAYRRQGVGSYILALLKQKAYALDLKPICSCETGNIGSRRAVENAGFIARNRVVEFTF